MMGGFALGVLVGVLVQWALFDADTAKRSIGRWESAAVNSYDDIVVFADDCKRAVRMARDDLSIWAEDAAAYNAELVGITPFRYREGLALGFEINLRWYGSTYAFRAEGQSVYRVGILMEETLTPP